MKIRRKSLAIILIAAVVAMIPIGAYAASNILKKPVIKSVSVSGRQLTVKYGKVKNATSYAVYRVKTVNGKKTYKKVASSGTTTAKFMGKYNTKYDLVVKAFKGKKSSKYSKVKSKKIGGSNTYVFFGSDTRTGSLDGYSDCIMLLYVNKKTKKIDVVSIYRDTYLDIKGNPSSSLFNKCNWAYKKYGPEGAVRMLEKSLDIKIEGYATTNFKGVADAIDILAPNGLTINVENTKIPKIHRDSGKYVYNVMNRYIDEMNRLYGTKTKHLKKSGSQKLNGLQCVAYARVRYTDGSDMKRTVRQRTVLSKMYSKFYKASDAKKMRVLKAIYPEIQTNIALDKESFADFFVPMMTYQMGEKMGFPFYKKFSMKKDGIFVPCDLQTNVVQLHKRLYGESKYKASSAVKKYSKKISKNTKLTYKKRDKKIDNKY